MKRPEIPRSWPAFAGDLGPGRERRRPPRAVGTKAATRTRSSRWTASARQVAGRAGPSGRSRRQRPEDRFLRQRRRTGLRTARGAYYAGPGNRFWPTLAAAGLTPSGCCGPRSSASLTRLRPGPDRPGQGGLRRRPASCRPTADDGCRAAQARILAATRRSFLAFVGKRAGSRSISIGPRRRLAACRPRTARPRRSIFVLPSPSGAARRYWDEAPWHVPALSLPLKYRRDRSR